MFRFKKGVPLSYNRQGYVYFQSLLYKELPSKDRQKIDGLCKEVAGQYWRAVLEFVTTSANATYIEQKHHISRATLYRYVQKYYVSFPRKL